MLRVRVPSAALYTIVSPKVSGLDFMDVVSENMKAYKLDKKIDSKKILKDIQDLVTKFTSENPNKIPILYIDIRTITAEDTSLIPKLEYQDCTT